MLGKGPFGRRFGSIFRELEQEMEDMERRMNRMLRQAREEGSQGRGNQPLVYGWTMNIGPEGEPRFRRFGNVEEPGEEAEEWREPFVTSVLDDEKNVVRVTAELPGVNKENIDVETFEDGLRIEAVGEDRKYRTEVPAEVELDPETAEARFNNGILEMTVGLATEEEREGHKVDIR